MPLPRCYTSQSRAPSEEGYKSKYGCMASGNSHFQIQITTGCLASSWLLAVDRDFILFLHPPRKPEATNTGPGFNRGSGGGARGCGFEERVGAHARTEGSHFL